MSFFSKEDLAKLAIESYLFNHRFPKISEEKIPPEFKRKGAAFVSLYVEGNLRGCIGDYQAFEPLYLNIAKNAIRAAFFDFRFPPLQKDEFPKMKIEVSLLSPLKSFFPKDSKELLEFLAKEKPGVMLEAEGKKALFLPQVWEKIKTPSEFLSHLCLKAGLPSNFWLKKETKYWIFSLLKDNTSN